MGDFTYSSFGSYQLANGEGFVRDQAGVITDTDKDDQFEGTDPGGPDPILGNFTLEYWGTLTIGDTKFPVFRDTTFNQPWMFAQPGETLPTSANFSLVDFNDPFAFCFAPGTLITTPDGQKAVETLTVGDRVLTADGRPVPVHWIGRQTLFPGVVPAHRNLVTIDAGALGDGLPNHPLTLTADHGLILDQLVVNAGALVNDTTIRRVDIGSGAITVYHVETEDHDVILANGATAETFIDYAGRKAFDNYEEYLALYGADRIIRENPLPRISSARMLPQALRERLGIGAAQTGNAMRVA